MFKRAVHPGAILKDEIAELGISATEFARQLDVPANRISQIIAHRRSISCDTALRLGHWFGMDPQFWLNLQTQFDLVQATNDMGTLINQLPTKPAAETDQARDRAVPSFRQAPALGRVLLLPKRFDVADHPQFNAAACP